MKHNFQISYITPSGERERYFTTAGSAKDMINKLKEKLKEFKANGCKLRSVISISRKAINQLP